MTTSALAPTASPESSGHLRSLTDEAYVAVKRKIIRCQMYPGQLFSEGKLVQDLGIGKTPVREALARLIQEGLVRSIPRSGYEVTVITLRDVQELFELRRVVESAAAQLAAGHVDVARLEALDEVCREGMTIGDEESEARFLHANHQFHTSVARSCGNRRLAEAVERVLDESQRVFHLSMRLSNRRERMFHEHRDLIGMLAAGDSEGARTTTVQRLLLAQQTMLEALISSPSVLSTPVTMPTRLLATP